MDEVYARLQLIEEKLARLIVLHEGRAAKEEAWIDSKSFCAAVGLKDKHALHYAMAKGVISGDALRNIGTAKRPRYRFHRRLAVDQFLSRSA